MKKKIIGLLTVFIAVVFSAWPLFGKGFIPTHDGEYHIIRFMEFGRMIADGNLFPRWAPTLNSGYGIPIFIFHYPLPNYIGVLLHFFRFQYVNAFQVGLAIGYIGAALGCFLWLTKLFGVRGAVIGTITAFFVPYWFVELYIRGSIGEVWSLFFLFFILFSIEQRWNLLLAISIGGMILSHNILSMLFIPLILLYANIRKKHIYLWIVAGILLSSYFWMPALFEQRYVVGLNSVNFREHFASWYELLIPSWGSGFFGTSSFGNAMSVQIGIIPIFVMVITLIQFKKENNIQMKKVLSYMFIIIAAAIFLMLSISAPIWRVIPLLPFIQYPWRLLVYTIPVVAVFSASIVKRINWLTGIMCAVLAILFAYPYYHPVIYAPRDDAYYQSRKNFTDGTSSMGNTFSTIWSSWKQERSVFIIKVVNGKVNGIGKKNTYTNRSYEVIADATANVQLPILYYPGWTAYVDKMKKPIDYIFDGTIRLDVPKGSHTITVVFRETPLRLFADVLSLASFLALIVWGILHIYAYRHQHSSS